MMGKWMSRYEQKHVSGDSRDVYQDPKEELRWIRVGGYGTCPQVNKVVG